MSQSLFAKAAAAVVTELTPETKKRPLLAIVATGVKSELSKLAFVDRSAEWQRVNSYIADALKDMHVLYAKLARLQGDFAGTELERIEKLSEQILTLGSDMSSFSKEFTQGKLNMVESPAFQSGRPPQQQQGPAPTPASPAPSPPPAPTESEMPVVMEEEEEEEEAPKEEKEETKE